MHKAQPTTCLESPKKITPTVPQTEPPTIQIKWRMKMRLMLWLKRVPPRWRLQQHSLHREGNTASPVGNVQTTIHGSFHGTEDASTGGGAVEADIQVATESSRLSILILHVVLLTISHLLAFVDGVQAKLLQQLSMLQAEQDFIKTVCIILKLVFNGQNFYLSQMYTGYAHIHKLMKLGTQHRVIFKKKKKIHQPPVNDVHQETRHLDSNLIPQKSANSTTV